MAFQHTGSDIELTKNESNGKFDIAWSTKGANKGNPIFGNTRAHTVLSLMISRKGQYYWDTAGTRGSLLYTVKQDITTTRSQLISYSEQAIQPAVDSLVIKSFSADATRVKVGTWNLTINWSDPVDSYSTSIRF